MSFGRLIGSFCGLFVFGLAFSQTVSGVTFASDPGVVYVPLRDSAKLLGLNIDWNEESQLVMIDDQGYKESFFRLLYDGTKLVPIKTFTSLGATIQNNSSDNSIVINKGSNTATVVMGAKHVEVSIDEQKLRAWQGDLLVMETNISSGRPGHSTPRGKFKAGPAKSSMHYSRLYNNAPMPWSVQINGDVFIHGYRSVPSYPASHGCIRMPLGRKNAAKYFYHWVDLGTPVWVQKDFSPEREAVSSMPKQTTIAIKQS